MKPATPLPYVVGPSDGHGPTIISAPARDAGRGDYIVGCAYLGDYEGAERDADTDAAYLVHAGNAYPRLVHRAQCRVAFLTGMLNTLPVRLRPHYEATVRAELENDIALLRDLGEGR